MGLDPEPRFAPKSEMALRLQKKTNGVGKNSLLRIEIESNDHYQNVALGLEFLSEAPNPQNILSQTNKY